MAAPNLQVVDRDDHHARDRAIMVARHLEARGISAPLVLAAMGEVQREGSLPIRTPLPIEAGQTISQPYILSCGPH